MNKKLSKKDIQKVVWKFIYDFRDELVKQCAKDIDFMIIYGSAVRGEFVPSKSDVDIVVQILDKEQKEYMEKTASKIFWDTSEKYPELGFKDSLSVSKKKTSKWMAKVMQKVEKASFLYVPVFIFVKGEIDWKNGEIHKKNPIISLGKNLLIPQRSVFLKFKQEGKVLYGRDIRKEIKIRLKLIDRLRLGIAPQMLSFIGFTVSPFLPNKGRNYAVKALLYQIDGLLTAIHDYEKLKIEQKIEKNEKILLNEFTDQVKDILKLDLDYRKGILRPRDFQLFDTALKLKWGEIHLTYPGKIFFCFRAWFFIIRCNLRAIAYVILKRARK